MTSIEIILRDNFILSRIFLFLGYGVGVNVPFVSPKSHYYGNMLKDLKTSLL